MLFELLQTVGHPSKSFTCINSCNHHSSMRQIILLSPFYRWRNKGSEEFRNFANIIQLVSGGTRIQIQFGLTLKHMLFPLYCTNTRYVGVIVKWRDLRGSWLILWWLWRLVIDCESRFMEGSSVIGIMSKEYLMSLVLPWKLMLCIQLHVEKVHLQSLSVWASLTWRKLMRFYLKHS